MTIHAECEFLNPSGRVKDRFAMMNCNLANGEGLPAGPFRADQVETQVPSK